MRILFACGGTLGSVTPLLAVAEEITSHELHFVGTRRGPERQLVEKAGLPFHAITAAKLRRYVSLLTLATPIRLMTALVESLFLVIRIRPHVIVGSGSFVSLPIVVIGRMLGVPAVIHELDVQPSLTNRILARFAARITVGPPEAAGAFPPEKTIVIGNPVRRLIESIPARRAELRLRAETLFGLLPSRPVVLVLGGGSGARAINDAVVAVRTELLGSAQILHLTGAGKSATSSMPGYVARELLTDEMPLAYAAADVVITRAGMGAISEILAVGIPAIVVPIPHTHQEANAEFLASHGHAVVVSQNDDDFPQKLLHAARHVLDASRVHADIRESDQSTGSGTSARRALAEIILTLQSL